MGSALVNIVFAMSGKRFAVSYNFEIRYDLDQSVSYQLGISVHFSAVLFRRVQPWKIPT